MQQQEQHDPTSTVGLMSTPFLEPFGLAIAASNHAPLGPSVSTENPAATPFGVHRPKATKATSPVTKRHTCTEPSCGRRFNQLERLNAHMISHCDTTGAQKTRTYLCQYANCGKSFTQQANLKVHIRKHTGERPYQCSYEGCQKAFSQLGNLKTHEKIHWPVKPYTCPYPGCLKSFTQRGNLKIHQVKMHDSED